MHSNQRKRRRLVRSRRRLRRVEKRGSVASREREARQEARPLNDANRSLREVREHRCAARVALAPRPGERAHRDLRHTGGYALVEAARIEDGIVESAAHHIGDRRAAERWMIERFAGTTSSRALSGARRTFRLASSGSHSSTGSSSRNRRSSRRIIAATAVIGLVVDARRKIVSRRMGAAPPKASVPIVSARTSPSETTSATRPGSSPPST